MNKKTPLQLITSLFLALSVSACASQPDQTGQNGFYVGKISNAQIISQLESFQPSQNYFSDTEIAQLRTIAEPIEVKVFFGEWCHDSVREVPRLLEMFKRANNPNIKTMFFALDTNKSDPDGIAVSHSIKRTPTIIVYKNDKELGRFLEFPTTNWANDITTLANRSGR